MDQSPTKRQKFAQSNMECVRGFIHRVSPFKGKRNNVFDAVLQVGASAAEAPPNPLAIEADPNNNTIRLVGFSPVKQRQLKTFQHNKTAVEMKVRKQLDLARKNEYVLTNSTDFKPVSVDFQILESTWEFMDFSKINSYAY